MSVSDVVQEILDGKFGQERKDIQIVKKKWPLFTDDMIFRHVENIQGEKMYDGVYRLSIRTKK